MSVVLKRLRAGANKTRSRESPPPGGNELDENSSQNKSSQPTALANLQKADKDGPKMSLSTRYVHARRVNHQFLGTGKESVSSGTAGAVSAFDTCQTPAIVVPSSTPKPFSAPAFLAKRGTAVSSDSDRDHEGELRVLLDESDGLSLSSGSLVSDLDDEMTSTLALQLPDTCSCGITCRRVLDRAIAEREEAISQSVLLASQLRLMTARRDHYARRYYRAAEASERLKRERGALTQELELIQRQQNVLMSALKQISSRTPKSDDVSCPPSASPSPGSNGSVGRTVERVTSFSLKKSLDAQDAASEQGDVDPALQSAVVHQHQHHHHRRKASFSSSIIYSESGETGYASGSDLPTLTSPESGHLRLVSTSQQHSVRSRSNSLGSGTEKVAVLLDMCRRFEQDLLSAMSELQISTDESTLSVSLSRAVSHLSLASLQSTERLCYGDALRLGSVITALNKLGQWGSTVSLHGDQIANDSQTDQAPTSEPADQALALCVADDCETGRPEPDMFVTSADDKRMRRSTGMDDDYLTARQLFGRRCESEDMSNVCTPDTLRAELPRSRLSYFVSHVMGRGHDDDSLVDQEIKHIFGRSSTALSTRSQEGKVEATNHNHGSTYCQKARKTSSESTASQPPQDEARITVDTGAMSSDQNDYVDPKQEVIVSPGKASRVSNSLGDAMLKRLDTASVSPDQMMTGQNQVRLSAMTETDLVELIAELTLPSTNLQKVEIINSHLDFERLLLLSSALRQNSSVTHISLRHSVIGCLGAELLACAIQQAPRVESLALDWNDLGDLGIQAMSASLQKAESLEQLTLGRQKFTDSAAETIKKIISGSRALRRVSVHGKQFSDQSTELLEEAARHYNVELILEALEDATPIHAAPPFGVERPPHTAQDDMHGKFSSLSNLKQLSKVLASPGRATSYGSFFRRRRQFSCIPRPTAADVESSPAYVLATRGRLSNKSKRSSSIY